MKSKFLLLLFAFLFQMQLNAQTIYYVNQNASGNNDGTTWNDAFTSLSEALDSANTASGVKEIWVAAGTYKPDATGLSTPNEATFYLNNDLIHIYGGFSGSETNLTDADPKLNETILSGDLNSDDSGIPSGQNPAYYDNVYQVVTAEATNSFTHNTLSGLIIEGGWAVNQKAQGAAVWSTAALTISNCEFRNNYGVIDYSAIYVHSKEGDFIFKESKMYNNYGGRSLIGFTQDQAINSNNQKPNYSYNAFFAYNNVFYDNTAENCIIFGNQFHLSNSAPSLSNRDMGCFIYNNTFFGNTLTDTAQGAPIVLHHQDNTGIYEYIVDIVGNIFWSNKSKHQAVFIRDDASYGAWTTKLERLYFIFNLVEGSHTLTANNLFVDDNPWSLANQSFIDYNIYDLYPIFTDSAGRDFNITDCNAPGVDQVNYRDGSLGAGYYNYDFNGNERIKGLRMDIGAYEVQNEFTELNVEQNDSTLVATPGHEPYYWYNVTDPQNPIQLPDTVNVIVPPSDGDYAVLAQNGDGCSGRADINYCSSVQVTLSIAGDSLVANGVGGNRFTFSFEGDPIQGASNIEKNTIELVGYGTYEVSHFNASGGCTGTTSLEYCGGIDNVNITRNGNVLEASVQDAAQYYWLLNTDTVSTGSASTYDLTGKDDGPYKVFVKENSCEGTSNTIYYCGALPAEFDITLSGEATLTAPSGFNSYRWQLNGVDIPGATQETYTAVESGEYTVIIGMNQNCMGTSNIFDFTLTGLNHFSKNIQVNLFPNPARNYFGIQSTHQMQKLRILDLNGKLILDKQIQTNSTKVDVNNFSSGVYVVQVVLKDETRFIKFIKQ